MLRIIRSRPDSEPGERGADIAAWREHCRKTWRHVVRDVRYADGASELPYVEAELYVDRRGRAGKPGIVPGPYLPLDFQPTPTQSRPRRDRQWLALAGKLADDMRARGLAGALALPPAVSDLRPWQWAGFRVEVLYTYCFDLPYDETLMLSQVRRSIRKAQERGFTCTRTRDIGAVHACLIAPQNRKHFDSRIDVDDLNILQRVLGVDAFRAYLCCTAEGEPVSASVEILDPDGTAIGWLAGTKSEWLGQGAPQLLKQFVLADLAADGATTYDWGGENIPTVAAAKAQWGGNLVPFSRLEAGGLADLVRHARRYVRFRRAMA